MEKGRQGASAVVLLEMKKVFLLSLFVLFFTEFTFSFDKISISLTPEFGIINGSVNEYVFFIPSGEDGTKQLSDVRKLSELDWDVYCIPYLGAQMTLNVDMGMYCNFNFQVGVPKSSKSMVDRDWVNCQKFPEMNWLTNYSRHDNFLDSYYKMDFTVGQRFDFPYGFLLIPEVFVSNDFYSFHGENGWGKYGSNWRGHHPDEPVGHSEDGESLFFSSKVIFYQQNRVFFGLGFEAEKKFDFGLSINLFGKFRFAYVRAEDHHINTYTKYLDLPYGFGGVYAGSKIIYKFNKQHSISLGGFYDWLPVIKGEDYSTIENSEIWNIDSSFLGGASSDLFSASINYTFTF